MVDNQVDKVVDTRLTRIEILLKEGRHQADIARELGVSRQAISKTIKRLRDSGSISVSPESTSRQKFHRVNRPLVQHDKTPNFDLHNIECVIPIRHTGRLPQGNIPMNNWKYAHLDFGFFNVMVIYGKEPKLKILPPKEYGDNISEVLVRAGAKIERLAHMIKMQYGCQLDLERMKVTRRPHLHPLKDEIGKQAEEQGIQYSGKVIEFNSSGDAHMDVLGFGGMAKYDKFLDIFPDFMNQVAYFAKNMETHIRVLNQIGDAVERLAAHEQETHNLIRELNERKARRGHVITKRRGD